MTTSKALTLVTTLCTFLACASAAERTPAFSKADLAAAGTLRERALADSNAYELITSLTTEVASSSSEAAVARSSPFGTSSLSS